MSIWGVGGPQFNGASTLTMTNATMIRDEAEANHVIRTSVLTGDKIYVRGFNHWVMIVEDNLHKYGSPSGQWSTIVANLYSEGTLHRHLDGGPYLNPAGGSATFRLERVNYRYLDRGDFPEIAILTFRSTTYVDPPNPQPP